jgi:phospholipase A1
MKLYIYILFFLSSHFVFSQESHNDIDTISKKELRQAKKHERLERVDSLKEVIKKRIENNRPRLNADSIRRSLENAPYFTLFKDNYFIGGMPVAEKIKASNSNIKFQLSVSQKLTRSRLPFDTYLFIQFTQKTIWNLLEESLPMRDLNFNPGIGLGHLMVHNNNYVGKILFMIEHESNGKDSIASRSWNKVSLSANYILSNNFEGQLKLWAPIIDSNNNKDILKYNGIGHIGLNYRTTDERFQAGLLTTWRTGSFSFNTQIDISFKVNHNENQYFFIQYYNGYGENLLDYKMFKSVLRIGFVIKSQDFSIY